MWQAVNDKLLVLKKTLDEGDQGALKEIRQTLLGLVAPPELVCSYCFVVRTLRHNHLLLFLHISNLGCGCSFLQHMILNHIKFHIRTLKLCSLT